MNHVRYRKINVSISEYAYDILVAFKVSNKYSNMDTALNELIVDYQERVESE
jgi:hypothetical protein